MKKITLLLLLTVLFTFDKAWAQIAVTPYDELPGIIISYKPAYDENFPPWAKKLYEYPVNFNEINREYENYIKGNKEKRPVTRYYKIWRRVVAAYANADGVITLPEHDKTKRGTQQKISGTGLKTLDNSNANWTFLGPKQTFWLNESGSPEIPGVAPWQVNVYAMDVSVSDPDIIYAGTETGYVNKSVNKGQSWSLVAPDYLFGAVTAVAIHPTDPNTVYTAGGRMIHKTTDGGASWSPVLQEDADVNHIRIHPGNPDKILASSSKGIYLSTDSGSSWTQVTTAQTWDIEFKPGDPGTVYALTRNTSDKFEAVISTDGGSNFQTFPNFPLTFDDSSGGLLAVTEANPNIVYATMLSSDNTPLLQKGTLSGGTWTWEKVKDCNTSEFPYNNGQGYFDLVLEISPVDESSVMVGTTTLFKTNDSGATFDAIGGYFGRFSIHPDIQDLVWLTDGSAYVATDGGVSFSTDAFETDFQPLVNGLIGSDMWGFDQGWNEDIVVGGRYHNGNTAIADFYGDKALRMGGAESPTGWVIQGKSRHVAFNDLGNGWILPPTAEENPEGRFLFSKYPNMLEYGGNRGSLVHHPNYFEIIFLGEGNDFWKSTDMGETFTSLHTFSDKVMAISISISDPGVIYADVKGSGLYRSDDQGQTWVHKPALSDASNGGTQMNGRTSLVVSPYDKNTVYACYANGTWGRNKGTVFKSVDGGDTWEDLTASVNAYTKSLAIQPTAAGEDLVYLFTTRGNGEPSQIYYRTGSMTDWDSFANNFPGNFDVNTAVPFYRDGKLRVAGSAGVWESPLQEQDFKPIVNPWVENISTNCMLDTLNFDDHSILNHNGAEWSWEITPEPDYISDPDIRNPKVVLGAPGSYDVTLTVTQNGETYQKTIAGMITTTTCPSITDCDNPAELPKEEWTLLYADSEETGDPGLAVMAFDDDPETIWHTSWSTGTDPYPHEMQIDLGNTYDISKFRYLPRQVGANGRISEYEVYFSKDSTNWGTADTTGVFENNASPKTVDFNEPVEARYMRIVALSEVNGGPWASAAEFTLVGCLSEDPVATLPTDNFTIEVKDETCRNSDNGIISISASEVQNYTVTLQGNTNTETYTFTEGIDIADLGSGTYGVCITTDSIPEFERCFDVAVKEPADLAVQARYDASGKTISLNMYNGKEYTIAINGKIYTTSDKNISLPLGEGENTIQVVTDKQCQGVFEKTITLSDDIVIYPNPVIDNIYINLGNDASGMASVKIYSTTGKLMMARTIPNKNQSLAIDASYLPYGVYVVKLNTQKSQKSFKIVKK